MASLKDKLAFIVGGKKAALPLKASLKPVQAQAWSSENQSLVWHPKEPVFAAVAADSKAVILWDRATGKIIKKFVEHELITAFAFSPDGAILAIGTYDGIVHLWDVKTGKDLKILKNFKDETFRIAFSPDGSKVAAVADYAQAVIWDVKTGKKLPILHLALAPFELMAWSPDGKILATAYPGGVELWNTDTGKRVSKFGTENQLFIVSMVFQGSKLIALAEQKAFIWDIKTKKLSAKPVVSKGQDVQEVNSGPLK